jgi:DASH complex subunit ASK1
LSGYEEQPADDTEQETTITEDTTATTHITHDEESESYATPSSEHLDLHNRGEDLDFSSLTLSPSHSTPRATDHQPPDGDEDQTTSSVSYQSPYEALRQEVASTESPSELQPPGPTTPGKQSSKHHNLPQNIAITPGSSPFLPPLSHAGPSTTKSHHHQTQTPADPVLHRVLDKTYRVQATPLTSRKTYNRSTTTPKTATKHKYGTATGYSSPESSPEIEVPKLHEEIFSSPIKFEGLNRFRHGDSPSKPSGRTPKPGLSVLTPGKKKPALSRGGRGGGWDSDDDDDDLDDDEMFGSPPKTMQFHVPQSRLLKTPGIYLPPFPSLYPIPHLLSLG